MKKREAEEAEKAQKADSKKAKEAVKNAVKKNKRVVKGSVKDVNYFAAGGRASAAQIDLVLGDTELIMGKADPDQLAELVGKLNVAGKDAGKVKGAFEEVSGKLEVRGLQFFRGQ